MVEEFGHLIGDDLIAQIDKAMEIQAVGAMRRNGTFPDNLVTGYTNPAILRAFTVGWIGARKSSILIPNNFKSTFLISESRPRN